ncbi:MAG: hypothetical protein H7315_02190 [Herminiimonas sp.]|nr:hypothetical protein [Herminiimonas sp.]
MYRSPDSRQHEYRADNLMRAIVDRAIELKSTAGLSKAATFMLENLVSTPVIFPVLSQSTAKADSKARTPGSMSHR